MFNSYSKPEMTIAKPVKSVVVKAYTYSVGDNGLESDTIDIVTTIGNVGDAIIVDNPLITNSERAIVVGEWMSNYVKERISLNASWRPDVRLDALDIITVENEFGSNSMIVTDVSYSFNGAFRGTSEGRVIG
jgi:hypothetical protein